MDRSERDNRSDEETDYEEEEMDPRIQVSVTLTIVCLFWIVMVLLFSQSQMGPLGSRIPWSFMLSLVD